MEIGTQSSLTPRVEFLPHHYPTLDAGDHKMNFEQTIFQDTFRHTVQFQVSAEHYRLLDTEINAVFPPAKSQGDHANVLPHIILRRSTHPWELHGLKSTMEMSGQRLPWMALLVFYAGEEEHFKPPAGQSGDSMQSGFDLMHGFNMLANELFTDASVKWDGSYPLGAQDEGALVKVIDVKKGFLQQIIPGVEDLELLVHVRQGLDMQNNPAGNEKAVIVANRMPVPGEKSVAHLVSVEGRYNSDGFNFQDATDDDYIRLVSLKSWTFYCTNPSKTFKKAVQDLMVTLHATSNAMTSDIADQMTLAGYSVLPHTFRGGHRSISWYRGPCTPAVQADASLELPARSADSLLTYDANNGMFDISYAAAWELGRLMALSSKSISVRLYQWKREHYQMLKAAEQSVQHPLQSVIPPDAVLPEKVREWFGLLGLLKGVPFNYLVPEEQLLPEESISLFKLDSNWVHCLIDGAFSIGRVAEHDHDHDTALHAQSSSELLPSEIISGFFLRSEVVADWPDIQFEGYSSANPGDATEGNLTLLRREKLSHNVLICLFSGALQALDIHQRPESLHFGLEKSDSGFTKSPRKSDGTTAAPMNISVQAQTEGRKAVIQSNGRIDINLLATRLYNRGDLFFFGQFTSAEFALAMIEGAQRVRLKNLV